MKKIVINHSVITFCALSLIFLPVIGGLNLILYPSSFKYALIFPQWSPALAAILVIGILNGKNGIYNLFRKASIKESNPKWISIALIIPVVCCGLSYIALIFIENGQWIPPKFTRSIGNYMICLIATIFGCYGEEIGWRGFMLPKLNKKHSLFISNLIVGLFWGIWHMRFQIGIMAFGLFILGVICYSFLISWLCSKTENNMFVAIVFHTTINMCSLLLFENILSDITEQQTETQISSPRLYSILYGIYAIVFAIPCIFIAKNMLTSNNIHKDA